MRWHSLHSTSNHTSISSGSSKQGFSSAKFCVGRGHVLVLLLRIHHLPAAGIFLLFSQQQCSFRLRYRLHHSHLAPTGTFVSGVVWRRIQAPDSWQEDSRTGISLNASDHEVEGNRFDMMDSSPPFIVHNNFTDWREDLFTSRSYTR